MKRNRSAHRREKFLAAESRAANHLALIRSFLIDSAPAHGLRKRYCAKNYCAAFASQQIAINEKFGAPPRDFYSCAALAAEYRRCKKSLFYRVFCNTGDMRSLCWRAFAQCNVARDERVVDGARNAQNASRTHSVKWSQCFFHCAVVNGVQCVSIPERTDATPAMLHG